MSVQAASRIGPPEGAFKIEIATERHDLARMVSVINAAYKKARFLQEGVDKITAEELTGHLSDPRKRLYLCCSSAGEICGTILLDFVGDEEAELGLFSIHPDYQGQKLGPMFIEYVEQEAFKNVRDIILKVIPLYQENLIKFYQAQGYAITGKVEVFPEEAKQRYIRPECRDLVYFSILQKSQSIHGCIDCERL